MGKRSRTDGSISSSSSDGQASTVASPAKMQELDVDEATAKDRKMQCSLPPHPPVSFTSTADFDVHYVKEHTNRCSSCGKNFPSAHYLALHIDEHHNPVREAVAAQGERTYACFVEDCDRKCSTPQKRRLHLIDKHLFPKAYNFRIIDHGIDKTSSLLLTGQRRRLSVASQNSHQRRSSQSVPSSSTVVGSSASVVTGDSASDANSSNFEAVAKSEVDTKVDDLERSLAALRFVPPSVQARQRNKKAGG